MWYQGEENAPELIKHCIRSWRHHNPGWTVRVMDKKNIWDHVSLDDLSLPMDNCSLPWLSNLSRFDLLGRHGGVWTDASAFCRRPLDGWLHDCMDSGFFAYTRDGDIIPWFMAAAPANPLVDAWRREASAYWKGSPRQLWKSYRIFDNLGVTGLRPSGWRGKMGSRLSSYTYRYLRSRYLVEHLPPVVGLLHAFNRFQMSWLFRSLLKIAPYLWDSVILEKCYRKDVCFRQVWDHTPKVNAVGVVELGGLAKLVEPISASRRQEIDGGSVAVYKLNWRADLTGAVPGTFIHHLFSTIKKREQDPLPRTNSVPHMRETADLPPPNDEGFFTLF